jgi:dihydrolipoamide dehydrogenase
VNEREVVVPDLGDFKDVEVVDVLVAAGAVIEHETPLITLETEKATLDVPADAAGKVTAVLVKKGDRVWKGSPIVRIAVTDEARPVPQPAAAAPSAPLERPATAAPPVAPTPAAATPRTIGAAPTVGERAAGEGAESAAATRKSSPADVHKRLLVLGAGPAGYTAAFRAADLGLRVTLVERWPALGGVCLNVGCIPSKALLHAARVIEEAESMANCGVVFGKPRIDTERLRLWKNRVVAKLTGGLALLARQRKVDIVRGSGRFLDGNSLEVRDGGRRTVVRFGQAIIATGSEPVRLPGLPDDPRIMDSTAALELENLPKRLLVIGGGIIGLEMACVYDALGVEVSVVELTAGLLPGCDRDLVRPLERRIAKRYRQVLLGTHVANVEPRKQGLRVSFQGAAEIEPETYDKVLVAVGRVPNAHSIGADVAGIAVSERGFIKVDRQQRTNIPHIFAIGDVVGGPMLAHKGSHEGRVAAEAAAGQKRAFDARAVPSVAYTDPEIAWAGLTETEAQNQGIEYGKGAFPWVASARSLTLNRDDGFTKLLFDKESHRVIGGGIVGPNAGELIAEVAHAIEMGSDATDIGLTIHPHPTLSETVGMAAEAFEGTLTDLYVPKK